jgi:hypothetical protein
MKMIQSILFEKPGDQNTDVCIDNELLQRTIISVIEDNENE